LYVANILVVIFLKVVQKDKEKKERNLIHIVSLKGKKSKIPRFFKNTFYVYNQSFQSHHMIERRRGRVTPFHGSVS